MPKGNDWNTNLNNFYDNAELANDIPLLSRRYNININICSIELKWDGKRLNYDMIMRWGEYE